MHLYRLKHVLEFGYGMLLCRGYLRPREVEFLRENVGDVLPDLAHEGINVLQLYPANAGVKMVHTLTMSAEVRPSEEAARQLLTSCFAKLLLLEDLLAGRHVEASHVAAHVLVRGLGSPAGGRTTPQQQGVASPR